MSWSWINTSATSESYARERILNSPLRNLRKSSETCHSDLAAKNPKLGVTLVMVSVQTYYRIKEHLGRLILQSLKNSTPQQDLPPHPHQDKSSPQTFREITDIIINETKYFS